MFVPTGSVVELVVRGSLMYILILAGFRLVRRDAGSLSVSDLLAVVLLAYRSRAVYRLLHPPSLLLVRDGHILFRNLRSELITKDDLLQQLREQGVDDIGRVKKCFLESDGRMSVIRADAGESPRQRDDRRT